MALHVEPDKFSVGRSSVFEQDKNNNAVQHIKETKYNNVFIFYEIR
jgi:hypothetical protein